MGDQSGSEGERSYDEVEDTIGIDIRRLSGESLHVRVPRTDSVEDLVDLVRKKEEVATSGGRRPVCRLLLDNRELKLTDTLESAGLSEGSCVNLLVKEPPRLCDECGREEDVDAAGLVSIDDFPRFKLKCCGRRLCRDCFDECRVRCEKCGGMAPSFTTTSNDHTSSHRSEADAPELHGAAHGLPPATSTTAEAQEPHWKGRLQPRPYQLQAFRKAVQENLIVNLRTNAGKTLVAVMLIDHFLKLHPDKMVLFVVTTLTLVRQQAKVIRAESSFRDIQVAELTGGDVKWEPDFWQTLKKSHVLVGIAEVLRKALVNHAFLRLPEMSLVVFDEAHHAIGTHPYVEIVRKGGAGAQQGPRILGLTASFLHGKMSNPEAKRERLERNLRSRIWAPCEEFVREQLHFERATYNDAEMPKGVASAASSSLLKPLQEDPDLPETVLKMLREHVAKAEHVFDLLGAQGWQVFMTTALCYRVRVDVEQRMQTFKTPNKRDRLLEKVDVIEARLKQGMDELLKQDDLTVEEASAGPERLRLSDVPQLSGKAEALLVRLEELHDERDLRCIVFVEQVATTYPLVHIINNRLNERVSRPVSGGGSMREVDRQEHLNLFKRGEISILVATEALEEGVDVPACNVVVRFDKFHNVKSHVQGQGRARAPEAVIIYFENDPAAEDADAARMQEVARGSSAREPDEVAPRRVWRRLMFEHPTTDAQLTPLNCLGILYEYVAKVVHVPMKPEQLFILAEDMRAPDAIAECRVPGREGRISVPEKEVAEFWREESGFRTHASRADFKELVREVYPDVRWSAESWERRRFAFVMVWKLMERGDLSDRNMPTEAALASSAEHCEHFLDVCAANGADGQSSRRVHFDPHSFGGVQDVGPPVRTKEIRAPVHSTATAADASGDAGRGSTQAQAAPELRGPARSIQAADHSSSSVPAVQEEELCGQHVHSIGAAAAATADVGPGNTPSPAVQALGRLPVQSTSSTAAAIADAGPHGTPRRAALDLGATPAGSTPDVGAAATAPQPDLDRVNYKCVVNEFAQKTRCSVEYSTSPSGVGYQATASLQKSGSLPFSVTGEVYPTKAGAERSAAKAAWDQLNAGGLRRPSLQPSVASGEQQPTARREQPSAGSGSTVAGGGQRSAVQPNPQSNVASGAQRAAAAQPGPQPSAASGQGSAAVQCSPEPGDADIAAGQPSAAAQPSRLPGEQQRNFKGELNQWVIEQLGRPPAKGEVVYECNTWEVPFVARVRLPCLQQHATSVFEGEGAYKKMAAEQNAAKAALEELRRPQVVAAPATPEAPRVVEAAEEPHAPQALQAGGVPAPQTPQAADTPASSSAVRTWCERNGLLALVDNLQEQQVNDVMDLTELSDQELDVLCRGLLLGDKGRFKRLVRTMREEQAA